MHRRTPRHPLCHSPSQPTPGPHSTPSHHIASHHITSHPISEKSTGNLLSVIITHTFATITTCFIYNYRRVFCTRLQQCIKYACTFYMFTLCTVQLSPVEQNYNRRCDLTLQLPAVIQNATLTQKGPNNLTYTLFCCLHAKQLHFPSRHLRLSLSV